MPEPSEDAKSMKAALVRLRIKLSETEDNDIRQALAEKIAQLEAQIPPEPIKVEDIPAAPPTAAQMQEAEQIIRQARVEKMRGNIRASSDLLKQASEVAPGSPTVLEALGDDFAERKLLAQARDVYRRASKLDPQNVGLERKFAMTVSALAGAGSIEDQLRANLSDSPFLNESEALASAGAAAFLSAFLPGLGHVVIGKKIGFAIMAMWIICVVWLVLMKDDLKLLISGKPNTMVFIPIFIMAVVYLGTLSSLKSYGKRSWRPRIDHPVPPVDKRFEL